MFDYNTPELTKVGSAAPSRRDPKAKLTVAVGSQNPVKVNSVKDAFVKNFPEAAEVEVYGYNVASGVPDQPWGEQETRQGALNRAENCLGAHCLAHGGSMPDFAVGLEGGVMDESLAQQHSGTPGLPTTCTTCFAFMAIMSSPTSPGGVHWGIARTGSFALPPRMAALVKGEGGKPPMELGHADDAIFSDTNSKQKGGTVAKLTKGLIDRTAYYEHAMHLALAPFVHDDSFPELYSETAGS